MSAKNKKDFFWPSYVDVMTNLFAITLVLFVVSFFLFREKTKALEVVEAEYVRIKAMNEAIQQWSNNPYFQYDTTYQKHILTLPFEYKLAEYELPSGLYNPEVQDDIKKVGISIIKTIDELLNDYGSKSFKLKFLVVIEGQASMTGEEEFNDILSYRRALYLKEYWLDPNNDVNYNGLTLADREQLHCELIVSGSGFSGSPREEEYIYQNGRRIANPANQRFLVHIVPVIDWKQN